MKDITFKKVERKCPHNTEYRQRGEKRGIIYDYEIWENGEKKGCFQARLPREYYLIDNGQYHVKVKDRINSVKAPNKESFDRVYRDFKKHIPSPQQIAEREAKKQREKEAEEEQQRQANIRRQIELAAPELLEACKEALKEFNSMGYVPKKAIPMLEQAIIKAEGKT